MNMREAAKRVEAYINETRKMIGNDPEVLNMANGHKLLASDLLLLAAQAQQEPAAYLVEPTHSAHPMMRNDVVLCRPNNKNNDFIITPLYALPPAPEVNHD